MPLTITTTEPSIIPTLINSLAILASATATIFTGHMARNLQKFVAKLEEFRERRQVFSELSVVIFEVLSKEGILPASDKSKLISSLANLEVYALNSSQNSEQIGKLCQVVSSLQSIDSATRQRIEDILAEIRNAMRKRASFQVDVK